MNMISLSGRAVFAVAVACAGLLPAMASAQTTVTFAGWGGVTQEAVLGGLFADAEKLGIQVREERSGAWPGIKAHLSSGAPGWDIAEIGFARCEQAAQADLLLPIDYSIVDKSKIAPHLAQPNYVGMFTFAYGIAYQKDKYGDTPPQSWADFWDVEKFPGRRSLQAEGLYALESALIADGVPMAEVYDVLRSPGGVDRAFAKLEEIKPHVAVWWRSSGQAVQLLRDGEVDMALFPNGRAAALVDDGADIGYVWNQGFIDVECFLLPKNAKNPKAAMQLINSALDPEKQAKFASMIKYGPVTPKSFELGILDDKDVAWLPTAPKNIVQQIYADPKWYASSEAEAAYVRFSKFLQ